MFSLNSQITNLDLTATTLLPLATAIGVSIVFLGVYTAYSGSDPSAKRMRYLRARVKKDRPLIKIETRQPEGLLKALIPEDPSERRQIQLQLTQAGFGEDDAVRKFFFLRFGMAMVVPALVLVALSIRTFTPLPPFLDDFMNGFSTFAVLQILGISVAAGFYGPGYWLKSRMDSRKRRIEEGFPNAMDLLQISAEAGMGFDLAMSRVSKELEEINPEISKEFRMVQAEVLAGREREPALVDMADRMGIDEAHSFVNVIGQSIQYGTSISEALNTYAEEMRETRELRAQEKANKLPVQMSAIMASFMLPALFILTLGPIAIQYMAMFAE
ncbi:type II secretion system F family protein [uncultured Litoreibacter sp.]|uniref:type II secretion system F family protein n=1 Tax=uncultured Litoreibacter sp. TaxID=1392394 RepID=UPI002631641E|nr:type II secretion system F family protein [uncultured Litoreibacter sp.]